MVDWAISLASQIPTRVIIHTMFIIRSSTSNRKRYAFYGREPVNIIEGLRLVYHPRLVGIDVGNGISGRSFDIVYESGGRLRSNLGLSRLEAICDDIAWFSIDR